MSDIYDATYQAVRSKIGYFDGQQLINEISSKFDISFVMNDLKNAYLEAAYDQSRPSILLKPVLSVDGDEWCALYGRDIQDGVAGFGKSPEEAYRNFDKNWYKKLAQPTTQNGGNAGE